MASKNQPGADMKALMDYVDSVVAPAYRQRNDARMVNLTAEQPDTLRGGASRRIGQALYDTGYFAPSDAMGLGRGSTFVLDVAPGVGDYMAFEEAETPLDYGLATVGAVPGIGDALGLGGSALAMLLGPMSKVGRTQMDEALDLAKSKKAIFHSSVADNAEDIHKYGVEPQHGDWVEEILSGAVDSDELADQIRNGPTAAWWDDAPNWVDGKVRRIVHRTPTDEDIRKYGHLAIADSEDYAGDLFRIPGEGLDNGEYSTVTDLSGNEMKVYETPLYEYNDDYGVGQTPFGIERNEIVTRETIDPTYTLTGDELVEFLRRYRSPEIGDSLAVAPAAKMAKAASKAPDIAAADEVLDLLKAGRGSEVTDELLSKADTPRGNAYLAENYDLPLDRESRMARADEMGIPSKSYHGTGSEIDFKSFMPSQTGRHGRGVYTGKRPEELGEYATKDGIENARMFPLNIPADDAFAREIEWQDALPDEWVIREPSDFEGYIKGYKEAADKLSKSGKKGVEQSLEDWNGRVVFDPADIRSVNARFDPRLKHLRNLMAGGAGVGLGLGMAAPRIFPYQEDEQL